MITLQESLAKTKERIEGSLPKEIVEVMHKATADLEATGIGNQILKEGDKAPEFTLFNQDNKAVSLSDLLSKGAVAVTFYRGVWCPYCNIDLSYLKRYNEQIKEHGATLISISPQLPEFNKRIIDQQRLGFDLLSDKENDIAAGFGLRWQMIEPLKSVYNNLNIVLPEYNGDDSWTLPVPARFIIGTDGLIKYAEYSIDYTQRPNPDVLIEALKAI